jgi:hypothetical protein
VFLHDNCEQISFIIFLAFLKKEEMRSGTHFTQQNVLLLFTVVVTKHVWPYFQSRFHTTSSERVSSLIFAIIVSFMLFTLYLRNLLRFLQVKSTIHLPEITDSRVSTFTTLIIPIYLIIDRFLAQR